MKKRKRKPTAKVPIMLRLHEWLREQVASSAEAKGRSMNAEINWLIEYGLDNQIRDVDETLRNLREIKEMSRAEMHKLFGKSK